MLTSALADARHAHATRFARCRTVSRGIEHPGDIFEAASLSAIELPKTEFPLFESLPPDVVDKGLLSKLQLEAVLYACTVRLRRARGAAQRGHVLFLQASIRGPSFR